MKKKILKVSANEEYSDSFFNIEPASKFVPEWYRVSESNIKGTNTELLTYKPTTTTSTFKKCTPFFDGMTSGYIFSLTADVEVVKDSNNSLGVLWRTERTIVTDHTPNQWEGVPVPQGYAPVVLKWHNQFALNVPDGYSLLFTHPINRFDLPFQLVTGIVDCDKYTQCVHFPFFMRKDFTGIIPKGTPLAQIIPIKRDSWSREFEPYNKDRVVVSNEKFLSTIKRSYKNNFWSKKEYK